MECPNCRASQSDQRTFCSSCGADLKTGEIVVPAELLPPKPKPAAGTNVRTFDEVPAELLRNGARPAGPNVLSMIGIGLVAVAAAVAVVFGIRFLAVNADSAKNAKIPKSSMSEFGNFGGKLSVRILDWRPGEEPNEYLATFQGEQRGIGESEFDVSEFVVVDPKGRRHAPRSPREPVPVTREKKQAVTAVYRLPLVKGEYELVWFQKGRRIGGWKVGCYKC